MAWNAQSDKLSSTGFKDSVTIGAYSNSLSHYTWDSGSDFERVMSGAFASATIGKVRLAATTNVSAT
ncbi:hypothetical protein, partial [Klebsiella pneumoniae]|uniref:hypothetical protein n=1 Tax=Klebsiella pneumoniae TaxID=573 RepID=UPI00385545BE